MSSINKPLRLVCDTSPKFDVMDGTINQETAGLILLKFLKTFISH